MHVTLPPLLTILHKNTYLSHEETLRLSRVCCTWRRYCVANKVAYKCVHELVEKMATSLFEQTPKAKEQHINAVVELLQTKDFISDLLQQPMEAFMNNSRSQCNPHHMEIREECSQSQTSHAFLNHIHNSLDQQETGVRRELANDKQEVTCTTTISVVIPSTFALQDRLSPDFFLVMGSSAQNLELNSHGQGKWGHIRAKFCIRWFTEIYATDWLCQNKFYKRSKLHVLYYSTLQQAGILLWSQAHESYKNQLAIWHPVLKLELKYYLKRLAKRNLRHFSAIRSIADLKGGLHCLVDRQGEITSVTTHPQSALNDNCLYIKPVFIEGVNQLYWYECKGLPLGVWEKKQFREGLRLTIFSKSVQLLACQLGIACKRDTTNLAKLLAHIQATFNIYR